MFPNPVSFDRLGLDPSLVRTSRLNIPQKSKFFIPLYDKVFFLYLKYNDSFLLQKSTTKKKSRLPHNSTIGKLIIGSESGCP